MGKKKSVDKEKISKIIVRDQLKIKSALKDAIDFLENWYNILPKKEEEYIFNHIAVFEPYLSKKITSVLEPSGGVSQTPTQKHEAAPATKPALPDDLYLFDYKIEFRLIGHNFCQSKGINKNINACFGKNGTKKFLNLNK